MTEEEALIAALFPNALPPPPKKVEPPSEEPWTDEDQQSFIAKHAPSKKEEPLPAPPPDDLALMPSILARSLSTHREGEWQYHPRTGRHSKLTCWGILFDLLRASPLLAARAREGKVVFGINSNRHGLAKELDLVLGTPAPWSVKTRPPGDLASHALEFDACLSPEEQSALAALQRVREGTIDTVHLAVEAKAAMTDHGGELPRLSDELDRFQKRIREGSIETVQLALEAKAIMTDHGRELPTLSDQLDRFQKRIDAPAISVGFVMINAATTFVSPGKNGYDATAERTITTHKQPYDAQRVADMARNLQGFDALGTLVVDCKNDGSHIAIAAPEWDPFPYGAMIRRLASLYEERFPPVCNERA